MRRVVPLLAWVAVACSSEEGESAAPRVEVPTLDHSPTLGLVRFRPTR